MKIPEKIGSNLWRLAMGLAVLSCVSVSQATPYATALTNSAGVVSFRLNQTTTTNDTIQVISSGGTVTNVIQAPGGAATPRGLVVTNLGIAAGVIKVEIIHTGSGVMSTNSPTHPLTPNVNLRGVIANWNPASPYFGWVYASVSASSTTPNGLYGYSSDLADLLGQGTVARTGGYPYPANTTGFSPYKLSIDPTNDMVLVSDGAAVTGGNLIEYTPDLTNFSYVLKAFTAPIPAAGGPVGAQNNHGELAYGLIVGTGTNRQLFTMDESYQTDPTSTAANEWNSVWRYDVGTNTFPYSNAPNAKIMSPFLPNFQGQNEGFQIGTNGYLYANQRRSNPPQFSIYICNLSNIVNPATYFGSPGGYFWTSQDESIAEGYNDDVARDMMQLTISRDGKWLAGIIAAGGNIITAPDGSTFTYSPNDIILFPLTNGIPNLAGRQVFHGPSATSTGRDIAFDAANNLYYASSGAGWIQSVDIGETTDATSGSDGTFTMVTPATQVTAAATTPVAFQAGPVPGVVTFTRANDDNSKNLTVFFSLSGTAKYGTNAGGGFIITTNSTTTTNSVVIPAGSASATVTITPTPATTPQLSLTAILTVKGSGGYSIGFPSTAIVSIADNHTPELHIVSLSTNIYQGNLGDYATLTFIRYGDTNVTLTLGASDFAFGGTAALGTDYVLKNLPLVIPAGTVSQTVNLLAPGASGSTNIGSLSILVTNLADGSAGGPAGYTVLSNSTSTTLTLKTLPPGTLLFSDDFETDVAGTNWNVLFGSLSNASSDFTLSYNYDYTSGSLGNLSPIPAAPHSTNSDIHGLYMTVNQHFGTASGLNLYLTNQNFSGNYAVRFDMYLVRNSSGTAQSQVENALFGINHDGLHTNWFRNQVSGTSAPGQPVQSDGLFFDIGADGNGGGGAQTDFGAWSSPTYTNTVSVIGPTNFFARPASGLRQVFKKPPYDAGPNSTTGAPLGGVPANTILSGGSHDPSGSTPTWAEVEMSQSGNLITWKINNTVIYTFTNGVQNITSYTNGTVMLGFCDPWDDIANGSSGSGESSVIYDNLRVVAISPPVVGIPASQIVGIGSNVTLTATGVSTSTGITNYQWLSNTVAVAGATSSSFTFVATAATFTDKYSLLVNDGAYSTVSASPAITPFGPPVINVNPASRAAVIGSSPTFTVTATTFSGTTNYQWFFNTNTSVAGATLKTLTLANVQATNFGTYDVVVNDGFNQFATSAVANLTLAVSPTAVASTSNGVFRLSIPTEIGPSYVVQFTNALNKGITNGWTPLITNAGTGGPIIVTNTLTNAQRFYRIQVK